MGRFESDFTHTLVLWSSCAESINCPQPPLVSLKINKIHLLEALLHQYSPEGAARPTQRPAQRGRGPRGSAPPAVGPRSGAGAARHAQRGEGGGGSMAVAIATETSAPTGLLLVFCRMT